MNAKYFLRKNSSQKFFNVFSFAEMNYLKFNTKKILADKSYLPIFSNQNLKNKDISKMFIKYQKKMYNILQ